MSFFMKMIKKKNIRKEVSRFGTNLRVHKYKIMVITASVFFPLYKPYIKKANKRIEDYFTNTLKENLQKEKPLPKITEAFLKQTINDVLKDQSVRYAGMYFAQDIISQRLIIDSVVKMLLHALQDPVFLQKVQILGQDLGQEILKDEEINRDVVKMMTRVFQDEEIVFEAGELVNKVVARDDVKEALAETVSHVFQSEEANLAMKKMLEESFNKVMLESETIEKFRIFAYNLMTAEIDGKESNNSLFDMMVKKMMSRKESEEKKSDIENILNEEVEKRVKVVKKAEEEEREKEKLDLGKGNSTLDLVVEKQGSEGEKEEDIFEELTKISGIGMKKMNLNDVLDDDGED